jgi:hypothetical protein
MKPMPTVEELKSFFDYEPDSGRLVWKVARKSRGGKVSPGVEAGSLSGAGYLELKVGGFRTYVHRVAWAIHYGAWPTGVIDHIDGDGLNNRISNLRHVTQRVNCENKRKTRSDNTSGFTGVMWRTDKRRWCAVIQVNGKRLRRGGYDTPEEAHKAYLQAKRELHEGNTL